MVQNDYVCMIAAMQYLLDRLGELQPHGRLLLGRGRGRGVHRMLLFIRKSRVSHSLAVNYAWA
jgi:hypothetical protein